MKSKINLILLAIIFSIILVGSTSAVYDNWGYKKPVNVTENSDSSLTDYQISLTVDTATLISAGKMQTDCDDIRFTDSDEATELSYWLESGCNTSNTKIWVKMPSLSASSTKTIYMYYGNSGVSSANNGTNTFDFFDDFEDGDVSDWSKESSAVTTQTIDGYKGMNIVPGGSNYKDVEVYKTVSLPSAYTIESRLKDIGTGEYPGGLLIVFQDVNNWLGLEGSNLGNQWTERGEENGVDTGWIHSYNPNIIPTGWQVQRVDIPDDGNFKVWIDGDYKDTKAIPKVFSHNGIGFCKHINYNNLFIDWVLVRKYASTEPTLTIDSEQQNAGETQPSYSNFTGSETTDFSTSDVANVTNLTLAVTGSGKINFPPTHSVNADGEDYNTHVKIENSLIFVNSSALDNTFNNSATLTFEEVNCNAPYVYYSDTASTRVTIIEENNLCFPPRCANIQCTGSTLTIDVTHFSGYAVNGTANLTIDADDPKYPLELVTFTAEYLNSTGFITDATCNISFTDGSHIMDEQADHYNYTRTFASVQIVEYNVTCNKSGESTVFANDTAVIQSIDIPEFSTITLGLGLIAVLAGLIVIRKK